VRGRETAPRSKAAKITTLSKAPAPVTVVIDIGVNQDDYHPCGGRSHGLDISPEPVDLARVALMRFDMICEADRS